MAAPEVATVKYADLFCDWLVDLGYTHCFFVAGGNIMHLLDAARRRFRCVPTVHEVAAGIAAEYFTESGGAGRAFALVTAGPGVTNIVTAVAGAWLESRELLVVGGQAKSSDLATDGIRQRGIQEICGQAILEPISVTSLRIEQPWEKRAVVDAVLSGRRGRPGPVFLEFCLDAQGAPVEAASLEADPVEMWSGVPAESRVRARAALPRVTALLRDAKRPVLLLGGGVTRATAQAAAEGLVATGIPVMTTWNGADRVAADAPTYAGRPNTWGQRAANILLHQADCIVALGTRLGLQQTGFNWQQFAAHATLVQAEIDPSELRKGHPHVDVPLVADANTLLEGIVAERYPERDEWLRFCQEVRSLIPTDDPANQTRPGFLSPFAFYRRLSELSRADDVIIPCSSGGANSTSMQSIEQRHGQIIITDKGLASMGYGLSGAIGAALAHPDQRTLLVEGDGGFSQNLQELATVAINRLNLKIFIFANDGYASIRATQRNYFGGAYVGCDTQTGLGFPDWQTLFTAYGIPFLRLNEHGLDDAIVREALDTPGPYGFEVPIDPEQTYFPKISSRVTASGSMESNPLHLMSPELPEDIAARVFRYDVQPADML